MSDGMTDSGACCVFRKTKRVCPTCRSEKARFCSCGDYRCNDCDRRLDAKIKKYNKKAGW